MMLPRITHPRAQLRFWRAPFLDGGGVISLWNDTYPEIFDMAFPKVVSSASDRWQPVPRDSSLKYLEFVPGSISSEELRAIDLWASKYKEYVLIGKSEAIGEDFSGIMDYCMALDFTWANNARTPVYSLVYDYKYQNKHEVLPALISHVSEAIKYLPIPNDARKDIVIVSVPTHVSEKHKLPYQLASNLNAHTGFPCVPLIHSQAKPAVKNLSLKDKISVLTKLYGSIVGGPELFKDKIVIIVDDLYQSGATMCGLGKVLRDYAPKAVIGLACAKNLKDKDNI